MSEQSWTRMNYLGVQHEDNPARMGGDSRPRFVVGVDGSEQCVEALRWAAEHAPHVDGEIHAVTGWEVPGSIFVVPMHTEADYSREAEQVLETAVAKAFGADPPAPVVKHLVAMHPAQALIEAARGAEMLVIGSNGRGLKHHLHGNLPGAHLGSVASYCVHHAPCPVVIIRQ